MSTIFRLALLSVLAIAASVRPAAACSCAVFPLCTTFWQADAVFIARAEVTLMAAEVFDQMMATLDTADDSPELEDLAALPRRITK